MRFEEFKRHFQRVPIELYPTHVSERPFVSVCLQTYQHAQYIAECLDGILIQKTNFPFEILIGEDASTDGTREICLEYAKKHPEKIRLILHARENNIAIGGNSTGRFNFIYNLFSARGKYIALCEGDDYWTDPLKLQKQVSLITENEQASVVTTLVDVIHEGVPEKDVFKGDWTNPTYRLNDYIERQFAHTSTYFFRSADVKDLPDAMVTSMSGDIPLMIYLLTKGNGVHLREPTSVYRRNPTGVTQSNIRKQNQMIEHYLMWNSIRSFIPAAGRASIAKKVAAAERAMARRYFDLRDVRSVYYLLRSVVTDPGWFFRRA